MTDKWKLGSYTFQTNPSQYTEQIQYIGDTVITLNGNVITQPTMAQEKYSIQSLFFQYQPRIITIVGVSNCFSVEFRNNNFYMLDNAGAKVNVYNANFVLEKTISVDSTYANKYVSFDVDSSENIYLLAWDGTNTHIVEVNSSGALQYDVNYSTTQGVSIQNYNGDLYVVTSDCVLHSLNPITNNTFTDKVVSNLPSTNSIAYKGSTLIDNYLVLSYDSSISKGAYHIDLNSGVIVNHFELPISNTINDVCFDGNNFIFLDQSNNQLLYSNGNTVMLDLYQLQQQLDKNGYLLMTDDMGYDAYIFANDYTIDRQGGNMYKYQVTIDVEKIDRGNNQ